jgi:amino acid transporter
MYVDQVTTGTVPDEELERFGYRQQFVRSLRHFESFAVAFSFISITTGIFTTYGFALATGGTRAIWTWPIVIVGQSLVALVYGALSVRVPLSGYSYQWASRLANVAVGGGSAGCRSRSFPSSPCRSTTAWSRWPSSP